MDRTERFYSIDRLLKERQVIPFAELRDALGVSRATLRRDLEYMRDRFNAPIEYDRDANGYRFGKPRAGPRYELPGLWFDAQEIHALLTTLQLLGSLQTGLLEGELRAVLDRLRGVLGKGDHSWREVEKRIRVFQPGRRQTTTAHFAVVASAVLKRRRIRIRHYNRSDDRETEREVSPQRLVHYRDNWYLDAWCHMRDGLRSFAVDAIRDARLLETRSRDIAAAELDAHLASGYGIFSGRDVRWAKLEFTPAAARFVSPQIWHPEQRTSIGPDGSYLLEIPYADDRELLMEILKFGGDVEVLAPPALRRRVVDALRRAASRYA